MAAYLTTSMLTTVSSIASAIWLFARHPDEWRAVRDDPSLVPGAYNEVLRLESPFHVSSRSVRREHELEDATLPAGSRVLLLFASANRDERKWEDPERFDVRRKANDHVAFGHGVHACPGQGLARLESQSIVAALASAAEVIEAGRPSWRLNNVVRVMSTLPVTVRSSARHRPQRRPLARRVRRASTVIEPRHSLAATGDQASQLKVQPPSSA
jgi:cytochrome P450